MGFIGAAADEPSSVSKAGAQIGVHAAISFFTSAMASGPMPSPEGGGLFSSPWETSCLLGKTAALLDFRPLTRKRFAVSLGSV